MPKSSHRSSTPPTEPITRAHRMRFGAETRDDGTVRFRLWARSHQAIQIELDAMEEPGAMRRDSEGWHELITDQARPGTRYRFILPDGTRVPDPASRHQPKDVHGPSEVVDPATYVWADAEWRGRSWETAVLYELHVGAFTPEGTFRAAIDKLDHLVALGVTAIEIMPIADFPGARNWGYDGVLPFAPDASYGRPEDLKALVDASHARGLMVLLDVVYNHFGPEGAYIHTIAPETFTERHRTPWGAAVNMDGLDSQPVREFFIDNAMYWIEEFNLDGLRLDAVHAIVDASDSHILEELADRVRAAFPDRHIHLLLENEANSAERLRRHEGGPEGLTSGDTVPRWYTAQWNDDAHHVLHVAASGDNEGYYADYIGDTNKLGRALAEGFAFQGEFMPYRGHPRGEPSRHLPPTAFVAFIQNHDQVGNRPFGDRLTAIASPAAVRAVAAVYLLLPQIPMLFMGEEWGTQQPFPFFCDFGPDLAGAVRDGRRAEFARFPAFRDPMTRERIPDPCDEATFAAAKLAWDDVLREPHAGWLEWYCQMLATRHAQIVPILADIRSAGAYTVIGDGAVVVTWSVGERGAELSLAANLSDQPVSGFPPLAGRLLWREGEALDEGCLGPWSVRWSLRDPVEAVLDHLAERMGVQPEYRDARGQLVRIEPATRRAVLAAMGLPVANADEASAALEDLDRGDWRETLPPVLVIGADEATPAIELVLPADTTDSIHWRVDQEDGGTREGRAMFGELELLDSRSVDHRPVERRRLTLPCALPWGYHRLTLSAWDASTILIVTPGRCWLPEPLMRGERLWGIAAQLYLLRSAGNWGIGDFTDLRELVELAASRGAALVGVNPLHAMFPDSPEHASPYSPASRLLLNVLNIDIGALPEARDSPTTRRLIASWRDQIEACRAKPKVDYTTVTHLKLSVLETLFDEYRGAPEPSRWRAFVAFRRLQGDALEKTCLFLALREHFAAATPPRPDWHDWPEPFRHPDSPEVERFRRERRYRLEFLAWLQFVADEQLSLAAASAADRGMTIGLYRDLAIGADRSGAETWANTTAVVSGARIGAPPDIGNPSGQDWGLPPFHPRALRAEAYRSFIELIRANMRHAGGLRIDHVMGLQQLWWVPVGARPDAGAYVRYPVDDLIGILALESHRRRCLVVGEDLGTVPEGFHERMAAANILCYRVLFFEQDGASGGYRPPSNYPRLALAVAGSHDLPTLTGWWRERDVELKRRLGLFPRGSEDAVAEAQTRARDRTRLLEALRREGLLTPEADPDPERLIEAIHAYLTRAPSMLAIAQLDDLMLEAEPVNLPTTSTEHPNWRRRMSMTVQELSGRRSFEAIAREFNATRRDAARPARDTAMPRDHG